MPISCKSDLPPGAVALWAAALLGLVAGIALLVGGAKNNERSFMAACEKHGGNTVYNGREYVCLKGQ